MSKCNPSHPFTFNKSVGWNANGEYPVVMVRREGTVAGWFQQGDDGQWWFHPDQDEYERATPLSVYDLQHLLGVAHHLNAGGDLPPTEN